MLISNHKLQESVDLLCQLIRTPSFSKEEKETADIIESFLKSKGIRPLRIANNILAFNKHRNPQKPLIVLNSHHDTVKVSKGWKKDPFGASIENGKLFGLGSNDAGAPLVSLISTFIHFYNEKDLPYQLCMIASAEEEIFGAGGVSMVLETMNLDISFAIIGEPTGMQMAVAEKGLMVIDGLSTGSAGHVANQKVGNAIYSALNDIQWIKNYKFKNVSKVLGPVSAQVTQIQAGYQHNIIPDECKFVIDVRINEMYSLQEVLDILKSHCTAILTPRTLKWQPSKISLDHEIVKRGIELGLSFYGSPTLSDQVHYNCPTIKIGCGESNRSHTADEFIKIEELRHGMETYIKLLKQLKF